MKEIHPNPAAEETASLCHLHSSEIPNFAITEFK
jgi:hypothetical protein